MAKIPTREVVRAKLFQLVNDKGDVVAELKTTGDGYPSLSLLDKAGKKRLVAELPDSGPCLHMEGVEGFDLFHVGLSKHHGPNLHLRGRDGQSRIRIGFMHAFEDPSMPHLEMESTRGNILLDTRHIALDWLGLKLSSPNEESSIIVALDDKCNPFMNMTNRRKKKDRWWFL